MRISIMGAVAALTLSALPLHAASIDAGDLLSGFNAIALGNLNASSETEGTLFVGGNLISKGYTVYTRTTGQVTLGGNTGALFVGGNITGGNVNVNNGGNVVVGGNVNATLNRNGGGTLTTGATIPVDDVKDALLDLSADLATYATTPGASVNTLDQNQKSLTSGAGGTGMFEHIAILNLTSAQGMSLLKGGTFKTLNRTPGVTLIVNIAGAGHDITTNFNILDTNVLFNFFEATKLDVKTTFNFGILAPMANITATGGGTKGVIVGNNITQSTEFRPDGNKDIFTGKLPEPPEVNVIPLPAGVWLLLGGLGALAAVRRRAA